jgi:hypothetical protein
MRFRVVQCLAWPFHKIGDVLELRRLRQALPNVHRRLISTPMGNRVETDTEYLERLREIYTERFGE